MTGIMEVVGLVGAGISFVGLIVIPVIPKTVYFYELVYAKMLLSYCCCFPKRADWILQHIHALLADQSNEESLRRAAFLLHTILENTDLTTSSSTTNNICFAILESKNEEMFFHRGFSPQQRLDYLLPHIKLLARSPDEEPQRRAASLLRRLLENTDDALLNTNVNNISVAILESKNEEMFFHRGFSPQQRLDYLLPHIKLLARSLGEEPQRRAESLLLRLLENTDLATCCDHHLIELQEVIEISPDNFFPLDLVCKLANSILTASTDNAWNIIYTMLSRGIKPFESDFQNVHLWGKTRTSLLGIIGKIPHKSEAILRTAVTLVEELNTALLNRLGAHYKRVIPTVAQKKVLQEVFDKYKGVDAHELRRKIYTIFRVEIHTSSGAEGGSAHGGNNEADATVNPEASHPLH